MAIAANGIMAVSTNEIMAVAAKGIIAITTFEGAAMEAGGGRCFNAGVREMFCCGSVGDALLGCIVFLHPRPSAAQNRSIWVS